MYYDGSIRRELSENGREWFKPLRHWIDSQSTTCQRWTIFLLPESLHRVIGWNERHDFVRFFHAVQLELDFINFPMTTLNVSYIPICKMCLDVFTWFIFRPVSSLFDSVGHSLYQLIDLLLTQSLRGRVHHQKAFSMIELYTNFFNF